MFDINTLDFTEKIKRTVLDNGIKVILDPVPGYKSISIGLFLNKGSRDENALQAGYSHFCEHMLFKGTDKLNKKQIAEKLDIMGGYANAYTTYELVVLYNRLPFYFFNENLNLMYELFNNSIFDEKEFEMERDVIINEIRSELEDPHEIVHENFMKSIFPNHSLGNPIIGTEESIKSVKRNDLFDFYSNYFTAENLLIVISGNIESDNILKTIEKYQFRKNGKSYSSENAEQGNHKSSFTILPSEQVHLVYGTSKLNIDTKSYYITSLLNIILGESMSSRFFQKIREELGLCYSIYSFFNKFKYENIFGIYLSVMPKNANTALDAISSEISNILKNGISKEELEQAKKQKIGELILSNDILQKRMNRISFMELKFDRLYTFKEIIDTIKNIQLEQLNDHLKNLFIKENFILQGLYKKRLNLGEIKF